jgi:hypothetical protein
VEIMTVKQAAKALGISGRRVRQLCEQGIMGRKVADMWIIEPKDVERYKAMRRPPGRPRKSG